MSARHRDQQANDLSRENARLRQELADKDQQIHCFPASAICFCWERTLYKCQELVQSQGGRKKFRFKNKLMSLDGSVIDLSVSMLDWPNSGGPRALSS
jgi:hypothetical protein